MLLEAQFQDIANVSACKDSDRVAALVAGCGNALAGLQASLWLTTATNLNGPTRRAGSRCHTNIALELPLANMRAAIDVQDLSRNVRSLG